jgi:hypothetical protein
MHTHTIVRIFMILGLGSVIIAACAQAGGRSHMPNVVSSTAVARFTVANIEEGSANLTWPHIELSDGKYGAEFALAESATDDSGRSGFALVMATVRRLQEQPHQLESGAWRSFVDLARGVVTSVSMTD